MKIFAFIEAMTTTCLAID